MTLPRKLGNSEETEDARLGRRSTDPGDPAGARPRPPVHAPGGSLDQDRVAQIRRCGRAAGRRLGYKIRTFATDPEDRDDGRVAVWVVVTASNPDDDERIRERGDLLIRETLNQLYD
jgi:hypothetical protein